ncbi:MAG: hypothetical protein KGI49_03770 [Patescibacteria group bacterium]|nr:hypothetical protein [Patescibacteria group bacterium]
MIKILVVIIFAILAAGALWLTHDYYQLSYVSYQLHEKEAYTTCMNTSSGQQFICKALYPDQSVAAQAENQKEQQY